MIQQKIGGFNKQKGKLVACVHLVHSRNKWIINVFGTYFFTGCFWVQKIYKMRKTRHSKLKLDKLWIKIVYIIPLKTKGVVIVVVVI